MYFSNTIYGFHDIVEQGKIKVFAFRQWKRVCSKDFNVHCKKYDIWHEKAIYIQISIVSY